MSLRPKKIDFAAVFGQFKSELTNMYNFSNVRISGIDMFQMVYDMCTAHPKPHTELLFNSIADFLAEHATNIEQKILQHDDIVSAYAHEWEKYKTASTYANIICEYLNRMLVKLEPPYRMKRGPQDGRSRSRQQRQSIEALAFYIWKERILHNIKVHHANRLVYQLMQIVRRDRDGETVPHEVVRKAMDSFVVLNRHSPQPLQLYIEEFETPYLENTVQYYEKESSEVISSVSVSSYMKKVIKVFENEYIAAHQKRIHGEFEEMVAKERFEDCTNAYTLLSRIPDGVNPLLETYEGYISRVGKDLVARLGSAVAKDPKDYVESLIDLQAKYTDMCTKVFSGDAAFVAAVDKACRSIVNDTQVNSSANAPEVLARYCDMILKKNAKIVLGDSEVEDKLTRVVVVFKYVDDKDVFQKFYSRMLAKRLIYSTSVSDDAEMNMISRLKAACGVEYTSKLQRMFTDMTVSTDTNNSFKEFIDRNGLSLGLDFNIMVLTAGSWPLSGVSNTDFQLPSEQHNGRKLTWLHHLSKADVKLHYLDKRYELNVSLHQLGLLLLFNSTTSLTFRESFVDLKLLNVSSPQSIDESTEVSLNMGFTSKRTKIKVTAATQAETTQETDQTRKAIDEDRRLYLQAAIVRIMKARKELGHTQLVQEVINQAKSRFVPSIPMIKKCIEHLVEKDYLDRSKEYRDRYVYIS
ncbi:Cullin-2 [Quaeritorhiza haematococci]|nr:Cullin-2 [Quaeritorhiza haematococci]